VTSFFPEPQDQQPSGPHVPGAGANGFAAAGSPTIRPAAPRTSRWAGSATTFGPVGRLVGTALMLVVGAWLLWANPLGAALWWFVATPWVLRDLWRPGRRR
jgi:hypothetical protein